MSLPALSAATISATDNFDSKAVEKLAQKCAGGRTIGYRDATALVGVLSTQLWHRSFRGVSALATPSSAAA